MNAEVKKPDRKAKKPMTCFHGLQLFAVQSAACVIVLLIVVLLRVIGGDAINDISARFDDAMMHNNLISAIETRAFSVSAEQQTPTVVQAEETAVCAPLEGGIITSAFGSREDPLDPSVSDVHEGVDIAAEGGTPLAALKSGTIQEVAFEENGYGHYVLVKCDDEQQYLYAHCSSIACSAGDRVTAGEVIAYVGNTGRSTGDHVHIEWYEDGKPVDPLTVLPENTYV